MSKRNITRLMQKLSSDNDSFMKKDIQKQIKDNVNRSPKHYTRKDTEPLKTTRSDAVVNDKNIQDHISVAKKMGYKQDNMIYNPQASAWHLQQAYRLLNANPEHAKYIPKDLHKTMTKLKELNTLEQQEYSDNPNLLMKWIQELVTKKKPIPIGLRNAYQNAINKHHNKNLL